MKPFTKAYLTVIAFILFCGAFKQLDLDYIAVAFGVSAFLLLIAAGIILEDEK